MRKSLKIGDKEYKFKKDALAHYKRILNSYSFGESLNDSDYKDLIDLLDFDYFNYLAEIENTEEFIEESNTNSIDQNDEILDALVIEDIKVSKVQFNTKCFEIFYNNKTSQYISYLMIINNTQYNPNDLFNIACRNSIHNDIHTLKQEYFDIHSVKGLVKCQETGKLSKWPELVVDHRQPNTFSIIVDRFKEVHKIDLAEIEYITNDQNHLIFKSKNLTAEFREYHKEKASLRIVRKECNSSRAGLARLKKTNKDLTIK